MANANWNIQEGDSEKIVDTKAGAAVVALGLNAAVATVELGVASTVAKADIHPFWKWCAIASLAGHATSLVKGITDRMFPAPEKVVVEDVEIEEPEEPDEEPTESEDSVEESEN